MALFLNSGEEEGPADLLFGLWEDNRCTAYMEYVPSEWEGTFADHVSTCMRRQGHHIGSSENLVIVT